MLYKVMSDSTDMTTQVVIPIAIPIASNPQFIKKPVVEESILDKPVLEQPAVEESVLDKPVVDTEPPVLEQSIVDKPVLEKPAAEPHNLELNIPKKLTDLISNILNQSIHKELFVLLDKDTIDILVAISDTQPELFTNIEKTLIEIIKDNTIDSHDLPQLIELIKFICEFIYKVKHVKMTTKKRIEICSDILKFCIHILLVENKIKLDEHKKAEIDHLTDSCVSLLFYPKTLKPPGCFKSIFHKK